MRSSNPPSDPATEKIVAAIASDPVQVLTAHLGTVARIVASVGRRQGLLPQQVEDLESEARIKLLENDCARLRAYAGRSKFETYLLVCIQRLAQDLRDKELGSWEASAEARRIGPHAVQLETLWQRDGLSLDDCERTLAPRFPDLSRQEIERIAVRLPSRPHRRRGQEGDERLERHAAPSLPPDRQLEEQESFAEKRKILAALREEVAELSVDDRLLVDLRVESDLKISEIARQCAPGMGLDPKALYPRFEKIFARLKRGLAERGFRAEDALAALHLGGRDEEGWS